MSRKAYKDTLITLENIDAAFKDFLDSQKTSSRKTYVCLMRKLVEYTKSYNGKEMLADHEHWNQKIMMFMRWIKEQGYSDSYAVTACGMVRAFFDFHHKPLVLNRQERMKWKERIRNSEDYLFSKEDIAKMARFGNDKEKYIVLVGASFGLRAEDFSSLTYGKYRTALERAEKEKTECPIPLDPISTQKEKGVKAFPFLNTDALPIVQHFLEIGKDKPDNARVWTERPSQLTVVLQQLAKRNGIDPHGSRIRFHNLRKYLIDRLSSVMSESKWKQIVGKKISEGAYVSPSELRENYLRAMPSIVVSNGNGTETKRLVLEQGQEIEKLRADMEELRNVNKTLRMMFNDAFKARMFEESKKPKET